MAEILGIVAGATQLLDLSARLVLASSHLYTNLKNVPGEIEALKKNTQDFYDLLWMISGDLDGPLSSHPNSLHVTHRIVSIFNDAMKESEELAILLERLSNKSSSSTKRLWSSVAGLKEKTEIADRGRRIESLKASIQMWYQHQSIMRLRAVEHQLSTITYSQLATQSNLRLLTQQSARAIDINQSLAMKLESYHHAGVTMADTAPQQQRRRAGRNKLCTCRPSVTISHVSKWNFQLFLDRKVTHSTDCSLHTDSTTWSFGLRALSPRIQAMLGLQFGGWSLSMVGKISPHYVVDPSQSPAFVAVWAAMDKLQEFRISGRLTMPETTTATSNGLTVLTDEDSPLDSSYQRYIESICATLRLSLLQAFTAGTASPADRTPEGFTVLSQFLNFTSHFIPYQEALFDLLSSTVEILVPNDAGSDSHMQPTSLTPMQVLLLPNRRTKASRIRLQQLRLDGILISHGVDEISDEFRRDLARSSLVGIFNKHPCLLENYGQGPVHLAILQRSEPKLRDLLDRGKVDLKVDNPPLLTLAIKWPVGLQMLLNAGAELSDAIESAILQEQLQSISLLLDHGCPLFGPYYDLLHLALYSRVTPDVILLLIERLAGRRQELLQLALDHLPEAVIETSWCNYHLQPRPLLDYNAMKLYERLNAHCVEVPEALWPGPYATIYHSPSVHNSSSLAMKLYELGFHDIDKSDNHGTTPLISAIDACGLGRDDCPRLIQWYLDLGVSLRPQPFFTHVLSQSICFPMMMSAGVWISQKQKLCDILETFRQLVHGNTQKNDDCHCWCSTMGCTPVGVVLRKRSQPIIYGSRAFPLLRRRRWLYLLPRYSSLGFCLDRSCFTEICRLEIFDRLGMAHTCCDRLESYVEFFPSAGPEVYRYKQHNNRLEICPQSHFPMTSNERKELQEEDYDLKRVLDLYLELYLDLSQQHQGTLESFWISWWFAVDQLLPFQQPENSEEDPIRGFAVRMFGFVPQGDRDSQKDFHPLHLPGFLKDGLYAKARDVTGYSPDITALTSIVHACITLLDPRAIDTFLNQLEAVSLEKCVYEQSILKPKRGTEPGLFDFD